MEAAILMPLTFVLLALMIYLSEWFYNNAILQAKAEQAVTYGINLLENKEVAAGELLQQYAEDVAGEKLLGCAELKAETSIRGKSKVTVSYEVTMTSSLEAVWGLYGWNSFHRIIVLRERNYVDRSDFLRKIKMLEGLWT